MGQDRHSVAEQAELIADPQEKARREAENGVRQYNLAIEIIRQHVKDPERPFRLRLSIILKLHHEALAGIHPLAGTFRNTQVKISKSEHQPPEAFFVAEEVEALCRYVNENWQKEAVHLAAFVLWKLIWIHPFADGNGRTARIVSYLVLCLKMDSILPGLPTVPEQIAENKKPYYDALEAADAAWKSRQQIDLSQIEKLLEDMLAIQLVNAAKSAASSGR
ncbi:MAG: Fic family protein [Rhizobiales bacterium]|nr:Fic family protein [Hyphomicrobiales bacterium]